MPWILYLDFKDVEAYIGSHRAFRSLSLRPFTLGSTPRFWGPMALARVPF